MSDCLRNAVRTSGLSQYDFCRRTDGAVSPPELSRWLRGTRHLGEEKVDVVCDVLVSLGRDPFARLRELAGRCASTRAAELAAAIASPQC